MELSSNLCVVLVLVCSLLLESASAVLDHSDIRLVNVPNGKLCEGRLEVYHSTEFVRGWFAVCDRDFGDEELSVVCRQLGCPSNSPVRTSVASYGEQSGYMQALTRKCSGSERALSNCVQSDEYMCDFQQEELVGVRCNKGQSSAQSWMVVTVTLSLVALVLL